MADLQQYILRLLAGSILCAMILALVQGKQYEALIRTLCGLFLTLLLLDPLCHFSWDPDWGILEDAFNRGKAHSAYGTAMAQQDQIQRISQALEAYILDKAAREGTSLTVNVIVGEDLFPERAELNGDWDHHTRQYLTEMIERELGIAKENQLWSG